MRGIPPTSRREPISCVRHRKKNPAPDLGFYPVDLGICSIKRIHLGFTLLTLGSVPSNVRLMEQSPRSTKVNTFDGTDHKVDRVKPKVWNRIFFPCASQFTNNVHCTSDSIYMYMYTIYTSGYRP